VVAGQHGFVHLSLFTRKWKLFGNAGQVERKFCCFSEDYFS
jgi:hypothetical protein